MTKENNSVVSPRLLLLFTCLTDNSDWKSLWIKSCLRKGHTVTHKCWASPSAAVTVGHVPGSTKCAAVASALSF